MVVSQRFVKQCRFASLLIVAVLCLGWSATPASAQAVSQITTPLEEFEDSGVSGTASLSAVGNYVGVSMTMSGEPVAGNHPSHIHTGTCENFDPNPIFPLATVDLGSVDDQGQSRSLVTDVSLRDLLADDYVILVHKSPEELTNYFVCGEIVMSASTDEAADGPVAVTENDSAEGNKTTQNGRQRVLQVPKAGSGDGMFVADGMSSLAISLGAVSLVLALGGVVVTRRTAPNVVSRTRRR
jgi:hypothetical protein